MYKRCCNFCPRHFCPSDFCPSDYCPSDFCPSKTIAQVRQLPSTVFCPSKTVVQVRQLSKYFILKMLIFTNRIFHIYKIEIFENLY